MDRARIVSSVDDTSDGSLLVIAAVEREIATLRRALAEAPPGGPAVRVRTTGVGKTPAALAVAEEITRERPLAIVQVGCGGAFPGCGLRRGDVAFADVETFADEGVDCGDEFLDLETLGLSFAGQDHETLHHSVPVTTVDAEWLEADQASRRYRLGRGRFVTVSSGSGTLRATERLRRRWSPIVESMEGAAAALAARRFGVPFFEIRGISNDVGPRDRNAWDINTACERAGRVAMEFLSAGCPRASSRDDRG